MRRNVGEGSIRGILGLALVLALVGVTAPASVGAQEEAPRLRRIPQREFTPTPQPKAGDEWRDLILLLQAKDVATRAKAARELGAYRGNKIIVDILQDTFEDSPEWEVRAAAVEAMGMIRDDRTIGTMAMALQEDKHFNVRLAAARAMKEWVKPQAWETPLEYAITFEEDTLVTRAVLEAFEANNIDIFAKIEDAMRNRGIEWRKMMTDILIKLDHPAGIPVLADFVKDPDVTVRRKVIFALGAIKRPDCVPILHQALVDQDRDARVTALASLAQIRNSEAIESMIWVVKNHWDVEMRQQAATNLGHIKAREAIPALKQHLTSDNTDLRHRCIAALGSIGDPSVIPALMQVFKRGTTEDQVHIISAIGLIGDDKAKQIARENLTSEQPTIREMSAYVLGKLRDRTAVNALLQTLDDEMLTVQIAAITALGQIGDLRAEGPLVDKLEGRIPPQLQAAVDKALENLEKLNSP
jgi:HEAT repeat protein